MSESLIRRILVVDDEEAYLSVVKQLLHRMGYSCETALSAAEASEKISTDAFDVVVSDIRMKGRNGLEMMRDVQSDRPHLNFIIMTGNAADYSYSEIIDAGASDFISKPFTAGELKAKIERIDREKRILRKLSLANEALHRQVAVNTSIAELSGAIMALSSVEDISRIVLKHAMQLTDSPQGFVGYLDREGRLVCPATSIAKWDTVVEPDGIVVVRRLGGMCGWVLKHRRPILTNRLKEDSCLSRMPQGHPPMVRFLGAPAHVGETMLGQVAVANAPREYTEEDLAIVQRLAAIYALRIQQRWAEEELRQTYGRLRSTLEKTIHSLGSVLEMRDPYTAGHQRRVSELACAIALEMGQSEAVVEGVRMSGLVHDIGKISVPFEVLSRLGKLSKLEMSLVQQHSTSGYNILKDIEFPWPIARIVLEHHERLDGSGYPQGLKGDEILLEARVIAVADVTEAMSSHRPYRPALGMDLAFEEISKNRGTLYDPDAVDACLRLFLAKGYRFE